MHLMLLLSQQLDQLVVLVEQAPVLFDYGVDLEVQVVRDLLLGPCGSVVLVHLCSLRSEQVRLVGREVGRRVSALVDGPGVRRLRWLDSPLRGRQVPRSGLRFA